MADTTHPMFVVFQLLMLVDGFFMWSLIGQGALVLLAGQRRHHNIFYQFLARINKPVLSVTRAIMPRFILDQHIGFVAVILLLIIRLPIYFIWYANGWIPQGVGSPLGQ